MLLQAVREFIHQGLPSRSVHAHQNDACKQQEWSALNLLLILCSACGAAKGVLTCGDTGKLCPAYWVMSSVKYEGGHVGFVDFLSAPSIFSAQTGWKDHIEIYFYWLAKYFRQETRSFTVQDAVSF